ncbi:MAG TPA: DUF4232 domain-containing protein [Capillimicrobium sp.]|nr:DUF4232 domain-containing protein [Capillimicrobium sp.]
MHFSTAIGAGALAAVLAVPGMAAAATPRCHTADLSARVGQVQAGAGQRQATLTLRNHSGHTCHTQGYVGLQLADARGRALPTSTVRVDGPAPKVRLRPGARAVATLQWGVIPAGNEPADGPCEPTPTDLLVIPPDETTQTAARWTQGPVCQRGRFEVGPLRRKR